MRRHQLIVDRQRGRGGLRRQPRNPPEASVMRGSVSAAMTATRPRLQRHTLPPVLAVAQRQLQGDSTCRWSRQPSGQMQRITAEYLPDLVRQSSARLHRPMHRHLGAGYANYCWNMPDDPPRRDPFVGVDQFARPPQQSLSDGGNTPDRKETTAGMMRFYNQLLVIPHIAMVMAECRAAGLWDAGYKPIATPRLCWCRPDRPPIEQPARACASPSAFAGRSCLKYA